MDTYIRVFDSIGNPLLQLAGHAKGVISFSWTATGQLISGSWDGTARIWEFSGKPEEVVANCVAILDKHENGVQVLGLPDGSVATTSTGESVNDRPANFKLRIWTPRDWVTGSASIVLSDHLGSLRSLAAVPGVMGFATASNDGSVCLRGCDGTPIGSMFHAAQEDGSPPFILNW
jgi:WD40 repeat protein